MDTFGQDMKFDGLIMAPATVLTVFLTVLQISLASGSVDFSVVHQTSTDATLECSYNGKVETYPSIRVYHNGEKIGETASSTKLTFTTGTPLCGEEKLFSCYVNYNNKRIPKDLTLLPSHDRLTISTAENKSPCLPTNKMVSVVCLVNNLCTKGNVSFVEGHDNSVVSQGLIFNEISSSRGERRYIGIAVASMIFHRGGKVNVTCRATRGESTTKAIDVFECEKYNMDDQQITIIPNGLYRFPADKKVTIWCSVKNLPLKEKILLLGDNFYQHEEATTIYTDTTSLTGQRSYLAIAAATGTFLKEGSSNLICSTESGRSANKVITVEKNETQTDDVQKFVIQINDLHRVYANEMTTVTCIVVNMISKEKVWFDGHNFYQDEETGIIYETIAEAGEGRFVAIATAQVLFIKTGDFNLTCITASGGYASKPVTVEEKENSNAHLTGLPLGLIVCLVVVCLLNVGYCLRKAWPNLRQRYEERGARSHRPEQLDKAARMSELQQMISLNDDCERQGYQNLPTDEPERAEMLPQQVTGQCGDGHLKENGTERAEMLPQQVTGQCGDGHLKENGTESESCSQRNKSLNDDIEEPKVQNLQADGQESESCSQRNKSLNDDIEEPKVQNLQADGQERKSSLQWNISLNHDIEDGSVRAERLPLQVTEQQRDRHLDNNETDRYWQLSTIITDLTRSNISESSDKINKILDMGRMQIYQNRLINCLIEKVDDLYEEEAFAPLIRAVYQKTEHSDVLETVWDQFKHTRVHNESDVTVCKKKLKIFLDLDPSLSSRLLLKFTNSLQTSLDNEKPLEVMTFLLEENADPFMLLDEEGDTAFISFLKFALQLPEAMTSAETYLEKMFQKWTASKSHESMLNDVIKCIPENWFDKDSDHLSPIKDILVEVCLKMKRAETALCDAADDKGRTPLHNLIKKMDSFWLNSAEQLVEGSLWNLAYELITIGNVNVKANDDLTPYSMVMLWKRTKVQSSSDLAGQKITKALEKLDQRFLDNGAQKPDTV